MGSLSSIGQRASADSVWRALSLLDKFRDDPAQTRQQLRLELSLEDMVATDIFVMIVLLSDDYLKITPTDQSIKQASQVSQAIIRFFGIAQRLPMELQMVLCYRLTGSMKDNIKAADFEWAFRCFNEATDLPIAERLVKAVKFCFRQLGGKMAAVMSG